MRSKKVKRDRHFGSRSASCCLSLWSKRVDTVRVCSTKNKKHGHLTQPSGGGVAASS